MKNTIRNFLFVLLLCACWAVALKGPNYNSLRAMSMGNAFVAVAEDVNAVYYNPAGLNLMNRLGNYDKRPALGYYPDNWLDMQTRVGFILPDLWGVGSQFWQFFKEHEKTLKKLTPETLSGDSTIFNDMLFFDRQPYAFGVRPLNMGLAFHNFGMAYFTEVEVAPYIDAGIIVPSAGLAYIKATGVAQMSTAYEIKRGIAVGAGYRLVKTASVGQKEFGLDNLTNLSALNDTLNNESARIAQDILNVDHAFDLGVMWQAKREIRYGAALQNMFIGGLEGKTVTPELTMGMVWSPRKFQRNTAFYRKMNLAADFEDVLNNDRNYKFLSHINVGAEWEQVLLAIPSNFFGSNARFLRGRGALGFKGGYWTLGGSLELLRFLELEFATWADEGGYFTGETESRFFVLDVRVGL